MKIKKPSVKACSCGGLVVNFIGGSAIIRGGWLRRWRDAVCYQCDGVVKVAPRIILEHHDGTQHECYS